MYDIKDDNRRTKLRTLMKSYGAWVQYSGFELEIAETEYVEMKSEISTIITKGDSVRLYKLCKNCKDNIEVIGSDTKENLGMIF